jgi:hypothetical protein
MGLPIADDVRERGLEAGDREQRGRVGIIRRHAVETAIDGLTILLVARHPSIEAHRVVGLCGRRIGPKHPLAGRIEDRRRRIRVRAIVFITNEHHEQARILAQEPEHRIDRIIAAIERPQGRRHRALELAADVPTQPDTRQHLAQRCALEVAEVWVGGRLEPRPQIQHFAPIDGLVRRRGSQLDGLERTVLQASFARVGDRVVELGGTHEVVEPRQATVEQRLTTARLRGIASRPGTLVVVIAMRMSSPSWLLSKMVPIVDSEAPIVSAKAAIDGESSITSRTSTLGRGQAS